MPDYTGACWKTYLEDGDADKLVHCVYKGVIQHCGEGGLNAKAIELFVNLARRRGQKTYIELEEVRQTKGETGGLYPWLKEWGADILEQKSRPKAFRIQKKFFCAMLSRFPDANSMGSTQGILRLQGLGKEIWSGIDAQDYVDRERAAWAG